VLFETDFVLHGILLRTRDVLKATNQEVADRMYASPHTVAHHLRQAFRKLGIGSRVELACAVVERSRVGDT
jgi:DNA-binding CsgD family transcriptional regulator